jgi:predicted cupin superfamily sugar epimerase
VSAEADALIAALDLRPHPEGGWYRETFRDERRIDRRAASTAILFLLKAGEASWWHRVDAVEAWHWHAGGPLLLSIAAPGSVVTEHRLGGDVLAGQIPQAVVPAGAWQMARPLGAFALVGCTVAPGFDFAGFEMAPPGFEPT